MAWEFYSKHLFDAPLGFLRISNSRIAPDLSPCPSPWYLQGRGLWHFLGRGRGYSGKTGLPGLWAQERNKGGTLCPKAGAWIPHTSRHLPERRPFQGGRRKLNAADQELPLYPSFLRDPEHQSSLSSGDQSAWRREPLLASGRGRRSSLLSKAMTHLLRAQEYNSRRTTV